MAATSDDVLTQPVRGRAGRARRELARGVHPAVADALPPPVELGLGVHRDGPLVVRRAAGPAGAAVAVPGPVGRRPRPPHRVQPRGRRGRLLPGPRVLAVVEPVRRGAARRRDLGHHPAAGPRPGRARDAPPRPRRRGVDRLPPVAVSAARGGARLPGPPTPSGRDRLPVLHASLGVGAGQLAGLGPSTSPRW
jgi:hypothetical protein